MAQFNVQPRVQPSNTISLPIDVYQQLSDFDRDCIPGQFCGNHGVSAMWVQHPADAATMNTVCTSSLNTVNLQASGLQQFSGLQQASGLQQFGDLQQANNPEASGVQAVSIQANGRVPRPANAFILYRQDHQGRVRTENPNLSNCQISSILGKKWQKETDEVKAAYYRKSLDVRNAHMEAHPGYRYKPRKSSELKRRLTKAKVKADRASNYAALKTVNKDLGEAKSNFSSMKGYWSTSRMFMLPGQHADALAQHNSFQSSTNQLPFVTRVPSIEETRDQLDWGEIFSNLEDAYLEVQKMESWGN